MKQGLTRWMSLLLALVMVLSLPAAAAEELLNLKEDSQNTEASAEVEPDEETAQQNSTEEQQAELPEGTEQPTEPAEQATEPAEQPTESATEQPTESATEQAGEQLSEEPSEQATEERKSPYLDEQGHYLAPEKLVVCTTMGMDDVLAEGEQEPAPAIEQVNDQYTGVVAFYDYQAEAEQEDESLRFVTPWFFYYEKGVLQQELPAFVTVKGYLDLRTPAVAESALFPQSEDAGDETPTEAPEETATEAPEETASEAPEETTEAPEEIVERVIYVGREVYVDAESRADYLFAFNVEGAVNGPFTGTFEEKQYQNGLIAVEPVRALNGETVLTAQAAENGVQLTWNAVAGTSGARIFRSQGGGEAVALTDSTDTSYIDTTAAAGTTYTYSVRMYLGAAEAMAADTNYANTANWSNASTAEITYLVSPDASFTISAKAIALQWPASAGATQYQVLRSEEGADWIVLTTTNSTSYTDSKAAAGKHYFYTIQAKQGASVSMLKDTRASGTPVCVHPTPVLTLSVVAGGVSVSWKQVPGATGFRIMRKAQGESAFAVAANLTDGSAVSWKDTKVKNGTRYTYAVYAYFGKPADLKAAELNPLWFSDKQEKTVDFMGFSSVSSGDGVLNLKWTAMKGVTGYQVNYRTSKSGSWKDAGKVKGKTTMTLSKVKAGTPYYLSIRTYTTKNNKTTYSNWSPMAEPVYYHAPVKVKVATVADGLKVRFNAASQATGYRVYRKLGNKATVVANIPAEAGTKVYAWLDAAANLSSGKTYQYAVRAYYGSGDPTKASIGNGDDWSAARWTSLLYLSTPKLKSAQNALGGVQVKYAKVAGAKGYTIYRKQLSGGSWKAVGKVSKGSITKFTDTSVSKLTSGQALLYTVRANGDGTDMSYFDGKGVLVYYLDVPKDVKVNLPTKAGTSMRWTATRGAEAYQVYRKLSDKSSWQLIATTASTQFVDTEVTSKKQTVRYTLRAVANYEGRTYTSYFEEQGFSFGILWSGKERNTWVKKNNNTYFVDSNGFLYTGWKYINRNGATYKYYFEEKTGVLVTNMYSYFGSKMRDMKVRLRIYLNNNDTYASHVNFLIYDSDTDSYCIPAVTCRCIGSLEFTTHTNGAYLIKGSGFERWVDTMGSGVWERYATRIKGASGYFHSVIYTSTNKYGLMRGSYSSMARNVNDSNGCVRLQCIYAFLIQDIMKNGYGRENNIPVSISRGGRDLGPYGIPKVDSIPRSQRYDPTDPDVTGKFFYDTQIKCGSSFIKVTAGAPTWSYY